MGYPIRVASTPYLETSSRKPPGRETARVYRLPASTEESPILSHALTMKYLKLRKEGKIGQLWPEAGAYYIAPVGAFHGFSARQFIAYKELVEFIERLTDDI